MTPRELGFRLPAEWEKHESTWLSWPHNEDTWPIEVFMKILPHYVEFVKHLSFSEKVNINVTGSQEPVFHVLNNGGVNMENIILHDHPTNDSWCRDHGPDFLIKDDQKAIINWKYNAWGEKYPPFDLDDKIPNSIAKTLNLEQFQPGIVLEGGSFDTNGAGTMLTTKSCLLNPNRNPSLSQAQIEQYLIDYLCVDKILWLDAGIKGDDTDGHIDDLTRFVNENTVITMIEHDASQVNYDVLKKNAQDLHRMNLNITEIPMPKSTRYGNMILPASYANFYICNKYVLAPIFQDPNDNLALEIIKKHFPEREVFGIDCSDIIYGQGALHCLSKHEPALTKSH